MTNQMVYGVDLAKSVFQIHCSDARGKVLCRKQLKRSEMNTYFTKIPKSMVAMEACAGAHYWGRAFKKMGHEVRLISPQFVKPYVKSNKNDSADAEAIAEAATRPGMRFVAVKQVWQQEILLVHRVRERLVRNRTALMNEIRGLLHEFGIVFPQGARHLKSGLLKIFSEDRPDKMTALTRDVVFRLYEELMNIEERIGKEERIINQWYKENEICQRIGTIPGIGVITATAIVASMGDPNAFKNGREYAASLGLVPRQCSTGGKSKLLGISKRGDKYLRKLLVHGARNLVRYAEGKDDRMNRWLLKKVETRGFNKASVAAANKNARVCWAIMKYGTNYKYAKAS